MADPAASRLVTVLWLVAAVLATTAVVIAYVSRGEVVWYQIAAAVFLLVMAWSSVRRSRPGAS